jgi:hypothetical protein
VTSLISSRVLIAGAARPRAKNPRLGRPGRRRPGLHGLINPHLLDIGLPAELLLPLRSDSLLPEFV